MGVGVLGGMGPAAMVDFLDKLTRLTQARVDQDHVRVLGCTEISVAFGLDTERHGVRLYDSNLSFARRLLRQLGRIPRF